MVNLDKKKVITFGGNIYPREGWAVIVVGGPGSGKDKIIDNQIMLRGKVISEKHLIKMYTKLDKLKRNRKWDLKDPENVKYLHHLIKEKRWKYHLSKMFFRDNKRLENIIFNITGKTINDIDYHCYICKKKGYNVSLVWAVTNRTWALLQNLTGDIRIPEIILHEIHNSIKESVFAFLGRSAEMYVDEAWVVFTGNCIEEDIDELPDLTKGSVVGPVCRIDKQGNKFVVSEELKNKILKRLGPKEPSIQAPEKYQDYKTLLQKIEDTPDRNQTDR